MRCSECPYGEYDYTRRVNMYDAIVAEHGVPNDIYGDMSRDTAIKQAEKYCWCDKVGGKVIWAGHCSEMHEPDPVVKPSGSRRRKHDKRERYIRHQRHLKWLAENCSGYPIPVTLEDEIYISWSVRLKRQKPYYKRWYRGKMSKYYKRQSSKKIRRYKGKLKNGWSCHKLYGFWNELY